MNGGVSFTREHWSAAKAAWAEGEFDGRWAPFRLAAAESGFIYPPEGTKWDSWEDVEPTQRAIIRRSIEERPTALLMAIRSSRSWSEVIERTIGEYEALRAQAERTEEELLDEKIAMTPRRREARAVLRAIEEYER